MGFENIKKMIDDDPEFFTLSRQEEIERAESMSRGLDEEEEENEEIEIKTDKPKRMKKSFWHKKIELCIPFTPIKALALVGVILLVLTFFIGRATAVSDPWWNESVEKGVELSAESNPIRTALSSSAPSNRFCYIITDGWNRFCTPECVMYNGKGYKVFDMLWLNVQMHGSVAQYENANRWVQWIKNADTDNRIRCE